MKKYISDIFFSFFFCSMYFVVCIHPTLFVAQETLLQEYGFIIPILCAGSILFILSLKQYISFNVDILSMSLILLIGYIFFGCFFRVIWWKELITIFCYILLFILFKKHRKKNDTLIALLIIIGSLSQAIYGLLQYFNILNSNYIVKGGFANPAGLAACLVVSIPFVLYLFLKYKKKRTYLSLVLIILSIPIFLSESRAGILSWISIIIIFLFYRYRDIIFQRWKIIVLFCSIIFIGVGCFLFFIKENSAIGRLLIWRNSCQMITEYPFLGLGKGSFKAKYMLYQAQYFSENPRSQFALLADNTLNPFNEYLLFTIEYGLFGLLFICYLFFIILFYRQKSFNPFFCVLISIGIFSCFSYPLHYPIIILIIIYSLAELSFCTPIICTFTIQPKSLLKIVSGILLLICIWITIKDIHFELKWKSLPRISSYEKENIINNYEYLYKKWNGNPLFLYNFGAELNRARKYEESIKILHECEKYFNDYDVQMLLAESYFALKNYSESESRYILSSHMCPNRFLPLYKLFLLYKETGERMKTKKTAKIIHQKEIKVNSFIVKKIKDDVAIYLSSSCISDPLLKK